eukprot:scaffold598_cov318-Pavlova_lutheri.AAC.34
MPTKEKLASPAEEMAVPTAIPRVLKIMICVGASILNAKSRHMVMTGVNALSIWMKETVSTRTTTKAATVLKHIPKEASAKGKWNPSLESRNLLSSTIPLETTIQAKHTDTAARACCGSGDMAVSCVSDAPFLARRIASIRLGDGGTLPFPFRNRNPFPSTTGYESGFDWKGPPFQPPSAWIEQAGVGERDAAFRPWSTWCWGSARARLGRVYCGVPW